MPKRKLPAFDWDRMVGFHSLKAGQRFLFLSSKDICTKHSKTTYTIGTTYGKYWQRRHAGVMPLTDEEVYGYWGHL